MERERIVAIGLLTDKEELSLLGPTFDRVGPVEEVLENERLGSHELLCGGSTKLTVGLGARATKPEGLELATR